MSTTPKWVQDAVFYQIFPDRFARSEKHPANFNFEAWDTPPTPHGFKGGDLYGVAEKLDYLKDLGVNALYLNPIFASGSNHRYHTFDYYAVDELLGGNKAFEVLLDKAHKKNMRIVLDGVFNHASRGFWQFHHVLENGASSPYKEWFYFDPDRLQGHRPWGAYPGQLEQERLNQHEDSLTAIGYRGWWNLPALPKFNVNNPDVREFLFGVAEHWVRLGIDGWRLDVATEIDDDTFWQEFRQRVRKINPEAYIVAEIWHEAQRWLQGDQYDAVMNYEVTKPCLAFFPKQLDMSTLHQQGNYHGIHHVVDAHEFANRIDHNYQLYKRDITFSQLNLLDSHDTPRYLSCVNGDKDALKMAYLFLFTYPGAPCIYYGNEVGLDGRHDPDCRKSFPWDEAKWDHDLLGYMKSLGALRKKYDVLRHGDYKRVYAEGHVMAFARELDGESIVTIFNTASEAKTVHLPLGKKVKAIFGNPAIDGEQVTVPARSGVVIK
jgi:cyclomaltodextrinase / maltogenic alpha-amylase / neopullulanase